MVFPPETSQWTTLLFKDAVQSDLRMCTKEPSFYLQTVYIYVFISFYVLAKLDCCVLIIYYTLES
jgi:hypothetical protein